MKIWTLIENTACQDHLTAEHGLSLYMEACGKKILFDTGKTCAFADNAEKMGIDLTQVDLCILSHGHYDHGGGISRFLEINSTAPVYLRQEAFGDHYSSGKYIGLDPALKHHPHLIPVSSDITLGEGIRLCSCNNKPRPFPFGVFGQTVGDLPETYLHEQYLLLEERGKTVCVSGCSHKGILNIAHWFQPDVLIGGFHFIRIPAEDPILTDYARQLLSFPTQYYTCHCTGQQQYAVLKQHMGSRLEYLSAGSSITL